MTYIGAGAGAGALGTVGWAAAFIGGVSAEVAMHLSDGKKMDNWYDVADIAAVGLVSAATAGLGEEILPSVGEHLITKSASSYFTTVTGVKYAAKQVGEELASTIGSLEYTNNVPSSIGSKNNINKATSSENTSQGTGYYINGRPVSKSEYKARQVAAKTGASHS